MKPFNSQSFNILNSVFPGFNDKHGLMLCGYEEAGSAEGVETDAEIAKYAPARERMAGIHSFHYKGWPGPYDRTITKWFDFFGHPLGNEGGFSALDKSIVQTNWGADASPQISDYQKFLNEESRDGILKMIREFEPRLLFFLGSNLIRYINDDVMKPQLKEIWGEEISPLTFQQKVDFPGRKFRVGFQRYEKCQLVGFPHPSGSQGLSDAYVQMFAEDIGSLISEFRVSRGF